MTMIFYFVSLFDYQSLSRSLGLGGMCSLVAMEHEPQCLVTVIQHLDTICQAHLILVLIWKINLKRCEYLLTRAINDQSLI
jgi:hypothetical protein